MLVCIFKFFSYSIDWYTDRIHTATNNHYILVFVDYHGIFSGCFDMLHSGHVCFLVEAAKLGELHVGIWWGALLLALGGVYVYFFSPGRQRR